MSWSGEILQSWIIPNTHTFFITSKPMTVALSQLPNYQLLLSEDTSEKIDSKLELESYEINKFQISNTNNNDMQNIENHEILPISIISLKWSEYLHLATLIFNDGSLVFFNLNIQINTDISNKINIIIQDLLGDNKLIEGNLYAIDNLIIDSINKENAIKLNEFNNLISKMQSIKNIKADKKILETIKEYLNKNKINKLLESIKNNVINQDNYINYIITVLP
jgi:hypothetical protein